MSGGTTNDNGRGCLLLFVLLVLLGAFGSTAIEQAFEIRSRDTLLKECHETIRELSNALGRVVPTPSPTDSGEVFHGFNYQPEPKEI
jgi:hypothetical protein